MLDAQLAATLDRLDNLLGINARDYDEEVERLFYRELLNHLTPDDLRPFSLDPGMRPLEPTTLPVPESDRARVAKWVAQFGALACKRFRDLDERYEIGWRPSTEMCARMVANDVKSVFAHGLLGSPEFYGLSIPRTRDNAFMILGTVTEDGSVRWGAH